MEIDTATREFFGRVLEGPSIIDPILTLSPVSTTTIRRPSEAFLSGTWSRLVESGEWESIEGVVGTLQWRRIYEPRPRLGHEARIAAQDWNSSVSRRHLCTPSDREQLATLYPKRWDMRNPVNSVLADIYSFLRESGRSFLARSRRPFYAFRDRGVSILDMGGRVLDRKRQFFLGHPRWKFYIAVLVPLQLLLRQDDPAVRLIGVLAQETLAFVDP